ncbi:hypothetical protein [Vibrio sp.]|uniref:hypothetical protein n=1 Tax=Vibrio sp. TaxID=678 RepID=UPI003D0DD6F8
MTIETIIEQCFDELESNPIDSGLPYKVLESTERRVTVHYFEHDDASIYQGDSDYFGFQFEESSSPFYADGNSNHDIDVASLMADARIYADADLRFREDLLNRLVTADRNDAMTERLQDRYPTIAKAIYHQSLQCLREQSPTQTDDVFAAMLGSHYQIDKRQLKEMVKNRLIRESYHYLFCDDDTYSLDFDNDSNLDTEFFHPVFHAMYEYGLVDDNEVAVQESNGELSLVEPTELDPVAVYTKITLVDGEHQDLERLYTVAEVVEHSNNVLELKWRHPETKQKFADQTSVCFDYLQAYTLAASVLDEFPEMDITVLDKTRASGLRIMKITEWRLETYNLWSQGECYALRYAVFESDDGQTWQLVSDEPDGGGYICGQQDLDF